MMQDNRFQLKYHNGSKVQFSTPTTNFKETQRNQVRIENCLSGQNFENIFQV